MNNRRLQYAPVLLYTILLVAVWLVSWVTGLVQSLSGDVTSVTSPMDGAGLRWALLSSQASLNAAPWGTMAIIVFMAGLLSGSGILQLTERLLFRQKISVNERNSLLLALLALLLYCTILFVTTIAPWNTLAGVSHSLLNSPLAHGWLLVSFVGVLAMSLVYGFMYGNYRTVADVVCFSGEYFSHYISAFIAMIPASSIVPCLQYTGWDKVVGLDDAALHVTELIIYALPFVYVLVLGIFRKR